MSINQAGLDLIKKSEGFRAEAYECSAGKWTIGYGSTYDDLGKPITKDHRPITEVEAELWLRQTLGQMASELRSEIKVKLNDNQFAALLSLAYNIGTAKIIRSNTLKCLNAGDFEQMKVEWHEWRMANKRVLKGLALRRKAELKLFETPE